MEINVIGTLTYLKLMKIVPNFSKLAEQFGMDRHTIKKMYESKEVYVKKKKPSILDCHRESIEKLLSDSYVTVKAAYWYLKNEENLKCTYDNFKTYVRVNQLRNPKSINNAHPFYETEYGDMVQVDWVEDISLETIDGEIITFNLFSATLGASRFHYFEYTDFKTEADFKRCMIHYFRYIGGITKRILTDNMSAIVYVSESTKTKHPSIIQFEKDLDIKIQLCKARTPETKGKDEVSNKYAQWLQAYNGKIKDKNHLLSIIKQLNVDINKQINTGTNYPPILLFKKEKEYLRPLPNNRLLDYYEEEMNSCKVPSTFVITYKGSKYSVPPMYINKIIYYKQVGDCLIFYYKGDLIAQHQISKTKSIVYKEEHYKSGLIGKFKNTDDIDKAVKENLARFKNIGEK